VGLKAQLSKFSGIISKGFKKAKKRLIKEMLYGIQASKDVKLSNISRTLKEDQSLVKTEDRPSRNPDDQDFTDIINEEIMRLAAPKITEDMGIAIAPGIFGRSTPRRWNFLGRCESGVKTRSGKDTPYARLSPRTFNRIR
jgi:hypothetical protein